MNIVIVAGGLQTRFKELSIFPKVLMPTESGSSILLDFLDKTNGNAKIHLVINQKYLDKVQTYLKANNLNERINVISSLNTNGTFNTLNCLKEQLPKNDVLFVWSDLVFSRLDKIILKCIDCKDDGIVFTNNIGQYRYKTEVSNNGRLIKAVNVSDYSGNVPGVYYLKDIYSIFNGCEDYIPQQDLIDRISEKTRSLAFEVTDFQEIETKIFEYKDLDTYVKMLQGRKNKNTLQTRFFNKLELSEDKKIIIKQSVDRNYDHLIDKEIEWYEKLRSQTNKYEEFVPKLLDSDTSNHVFKIEYLENYVPLHKILTQLEKACDIASIRQVYQNLIQSVNDLGNTSTIEVDFEVFKEDLKKEVVDKVIARCEKIRPLLLNYNQQQLELVLLQTYEKIIQYAVNSNDFDIEKNVVKYYFTHGDLNGSNVMVNKTTLKCKFVDPRGYFGNTKMHGWKIYEFAKLLYCLFGYDDFNLNPKVYLFDWPIVRQSLEYSKFQMYFSKDVCLTMKYLVGIIYVALAGYISQDIMKANIAYDYGIKLLKNV